MAMTEELAMIIEGQSTFIVIYFAILFLWLFVVVDWLTR